MTQCVDVSLLGPRAALAHSGFEAHLPGFLLYSARAIAHFNFYPDFISRKVSSAWRFHREPNSPPNDPEIPSGNTVKGRKGGRSDGGSVEGRGEAGQSVSGSGAERQHCTSNTARQDR